MVRDDFARQQHSEEEDPLAVVVEDRDDEDSSDVNCDSDDDEEDEAIVVDPMTFCQPEMSPVSSSCELRCQEVERHRRKRKRKDDLRTHSTWEHPLELKKLLVGELAKEMSVTVIRRDNVRQLTHLNCDPSFDAVDRFVHMDFQVKRIRQHGDSDFYDDAEPEAVEEENGEEEGRLMPSDAEEQEENMADNDNHTGTSARRKSTKDDVIVDPETGLTRYKCRNNCGTSLASTKGRRKHERRHCPLLKEDGKKRQ